MTSTDSSTRRTMACAHCDHDLDEHFDADGHEVCQGCVRDLLDGSHWNADVLDGLTDQDERLAEARRWACVDFDH